MLRRIEGADVIFGECRDPSLVAVRLRGDHDHVLVLVIEEARQALDAAHAESASLLQETNEKLEAEIAALRRDAAHAREEERVAIQEAAAQKIRQIRSESAGKTPEVRKELVARVLPCT